MANYMGKPAVEALIEGLNSKIEDVEEKIGDIDIETYRPSFDENIASAVDSGNTQQPYGFSFDTDIPVGATLRITMLTAYDQDKPYVIINQADTSVVYSEESTILANETEDAIDITTAIPANTVLNLFGTDASAIPNDNNTKVVNAVIYHKDIPGIVNDDTFADIDAELDRIINDLGLVQTDVATNTTDIGNLADEIKDLKNNPSTDPKLISYNGTKTTVNVSTAETDILLRSTVDNNGDVNVFLGQNDTNKTDEYRAVYKAQVRKLIASAMTSNASNQGIFQYFGIKGDIDTIATQQGHPFVTGDIALGTDSITSPTSLKKGTYADTTNHYETASVYIYDGGINYITGDIINVGNNAAYTVTSTHNGAATAFDTTNYSNITGSFADNDDLTVTTTSGAGSGGSFVVSGVREDTASGFTVPDTISMKFYTISYAAGYILGGEGYEVGDTVTLSNGTSTLDTVVASVEDGRITGLSITNAGDVSTDFAGQIAAQGGTGSGAKINITTINQKTGVISWVDAQPTPANGMFASINNYIDSTSSYNYHSATVLYLDDGANPATWVIDQTSTLILQMGEGVTAPAYYHGSKANAYYDLSAAQYANADVIQISHFGAQVSLDKTALDIDDKYAIGDEKWVYKFTYDPANNRINVVCAASDTDNGGWSVIVNSNDTTLTGNAWIDISLAGGPVTVPYDGTYVVNVGAFDLSAVPNVLARLGFVSTTLNGTITNNGTVSLSPDESVSTAYSSVFTLHAGDTLGIRINVGGIPDGWTLPAREYALTAVLLQPTPIQQEPDVFFKATVGNLVFGSGQDPQTLVGEINAGLISADKKSFTLPKGKYVITAGNISTMATPAIYVGVSLSAPSGTIAVSENRYASGIAWLTTTTLCAIYVSDGVEPIEFRIWSSIQNTTLVQSRPTSICAYRLPNNNSDLMNKPNLWPVGVELDFGDGVYGQRFTGTITAAASVHQYSILIPDIVDSLIGFGGNIQMQQSASIAKYVSVCTPFVVVSGSGPELIGSSDFSFRPDTHNLTINTYNKFARTDAPYDVWATYTKT